MRQPCALVSVVNDINRLSENGLKDLVADDGLRRATIDATRRLNLLVQTPEEAIRSLAFSVRPQLLHDVSIKPLTRCPKPTYNACVRIAIDLHLFDRLLQAGCISAHSLAEAVDAEEELIGMLLPAK